MTPIRVLIADDHPVFRFGLRALLTAEPTTVCVGEATNGQEALDFVAREEPDVVLMDLTMPGLGGIDALASLRVSNPYLAVIVLTMQDDAPALAMAMRAGARGYLVKGASATEIVQAIHLVVQGSVVVGQQVADALSTAMILIGEDQRYPFPELTPRERDVLRLVAMGQTNTAIADALYLSPKTVRNHLSIILQKIDVTDRNAAIVKARSAGIGTA